MKKNILVTGANGYIGSHIISELSKHQEKFNITGVDFNNSNIKKDINFINYNILEQSNNFNLYQELNSPDILLHLAWQDGFTHNADSHILKLSQHFAFIKNLIDNGCIHIAVAGSFREYGKCNGKVTEDHICETDNNYSLAKYTLNKALKLYTQNKGICFQWLRFFTPYGDDKLNNSILSKILKWEKEGKDSFPFTEGKEQYDYIHVDMLAKYVVATISQTKIDGEINICTGNPTELKVMVENFIKDNNLKIKPIFGAYKSRNYDSPIIYGDNTKILKILEGYNAE